MSGVTDIRFPTGTDEEREKAVAMAALSIQRGELVVLPTDTVYGLAADAFDADAVTELLEAKGRGRDMPPPVLVSSATTLDALAVRVPAYARALVERFWPGPLTLVCHQQASLQWDLGDTRGTVAIRMPDHDIAREILERTGPLAVSSANLTGRPAATTADEAEAMLGEEVATIVDAGPAPGGQASTIVDATGDTPRVLREGALSLADLDTVLTPLGLSLTGQPAPDPEAAAEPAPDPSTEPAAAPARKSPARKSAATKTPATKTPATKTAARRAPAKKAVAKTATSKSPATGTPPTSGPSGSSGATAATPPDPEPPVV